MLESGDVVVAKGSIRFDLDLGLDNSINDWFGLPDNIDYFSGDDVCVDFISYEDSVYDLFRFFVELITTEH